MSLNKLGVLANMALAATAVLLPPTMTSSDLGDAKAEELLLSGLVGESAHRVALNCDDCPYATKDDERISWTEDALGSGNTFSLNFEIGSNEHTLTVGDGYQLFPPNMNEGKPSFYVTQLHPASDEPLDLLVTGYTFRYNGAETISEEGLELLPMTLQIASLDGVEVSPPLLAINVLKDASGDLSIASFSTSQPSETTIVGQDTNCNEWPLLCKWKAIVAERIEKMRQMGKGCHKRPHGQHNPMAEETFEGKPPHRFHPGRPHHHPHHRPHYTGQGQDRMHTFARRAFFTIFIPIIVGVFAGTVTYLIGMVLGTIIAIIIAKVRGECCFMGQKFERIALEEDVEEGEAEIESQDEKQAYAELPAYDAPPVYEATPEEKVDESK
ncbi:hypothetical protein DE146DRAFT_336393 [Phaeosphaeria sp. MPI-PUGE-AT-0046c]|nr:hypothetical protein DE146DRAFT_336393 [Phaeosphaeria sp. MPI-PUGE-AT-0046c]